MYAIRSYYAHIPGWQGNLRFRYNLRCDEALPWYNYLKDRLDEGNTHQLAGSFDGYANFVQTVRTDGKHASLDELHNIVEALVGYEYGIVITSYSIHYTKLYEYWPGTGRIRIPGTGLRIFSCFPHIPSRSETSSSKPCVMGCRITSYNVCYTKLLRMGQENIVLLYT